ncbi:MAG: hypothetical protein Ct9H300mP28_05490 [Pseudomonadota bacterium]|nr:MAG: hypothetical protein Ct9H300mP28_05490 [Pseudomonadota bacterium]
MPFKIMLLNPGNDWAQKGWYWDVKFRLKKQEGYERQQELRWNFSFMEQCARHIPETAQSQIIPPDETVTVEAVSRAADFTIPRFRIVLLKKILILKILQNPSLLIRKIKNQ